MIKCITNPLGPSHQYTYFIGPNPCTSFIHESISPNIDPSVFIGPFSSIIGDITISPHVFISCNVTLRADEGTPFYIGSNTNIQDSVVFHGLANEYVMVKNEKYSIYVGNNVSCAHGAVVHGPCFIGDDTFIGFKAVIFNAFIESNCFIGSGAIVTNGVVIGSGKFIPPGAVIDTQDKANLLDTAPNTVQNFSKEVIDVNTEFSSSYPLLFGCIRYSHRG